MAFSRLQAELGIIHPLVSAQRALPVVLAIHADSGVGGHGGSSATCKQTSTGLRIKIQSLGHTCVYTATNYTEWQDWHAQTHTPTGKHSFCK